MADWVNTGCPKCGGQASRETDTMPNWAGSSWYYLRYIDPVNKDRLADSEKLKYWLMVDWYNGGMEHTTLHLLYSRFWHKFLYDLKVVPTPEPYAKRTSHGVVLGPDGRRMSKSRGNVINPDEVVGKYGADTLRLYEMFMGPFDQTVAWSWEAVEGVNRFLKRVWKLAGDFPNENSSAEARGRLGVLVGKIEKDIENMKYNTAVAAMMEWLNWWSEHRREVGRDGVKTFTKVLAPMAPFMAEEVWAMLNEKGSVHKQSWPVSDGGEWKEKKTLIVVQVDGRIRGRVKVDSDCAENQELVMGEVLKDLNVAKYLTGKFRVVWVPGKLVNLVTE
jgi:leucyl-tRNA synthetase